MLQSMTGFGQAVSEQNGMTLKVEIKSLNSKFLDLSMKFPKEISDKETEIRNTVQRLLQRGKVNVLIELTQPDLGQKTVAINEDLLKSFYLTYKRIAAELNDTPHDLFRLALHSPDVIGQPDSNTEIEWVFIEDTLSKACTACLDFRDKEGASLATKMASYIDAIGGRLIKVQQLDGQRIENIKTRISKNLDDIRARVQVDENRFEQELIYYIEKLDITEEKVRLQRHLDYFKEVIKMEESQGKKLGFISQEIGREINTLGSKANDADIQQLVVEMKDELEKIKEQLLNIV